MSVIEFDGVILVFLGYNECDRVFWGNFDVFRVKRVWSSFLGYFRCF